VAVPRKVNKGKVAFELIVDVSELFAASKGASGRVTLNLCIVALMVSRACFHAQESKVR
jgi:hypothetical protein